MSQNVPTIQEAYSTPKVSVIIPAYNAMNYLPETVESVLRQTFTNFEVLIIDDGSSDNIVQWASELVDTRVKLIKQANQGVSAARNAGIARAQGEYVAFLDADDLWEPTKLEKQVRCLEDNPVVGLVHTWMILADEQGKSKGKLIASNAEGDVWQQLVVRNTILTSSVMVRRCCFENVGVFDCSLRSYEDWELWIRIASRYSFTLIKEPLVLYRQHTSNTSNNWQVMEQGFRLVMEKIFHSAPSELLYLKNQSYGYANLYLAWKALQSGDGDSKQALHFRQQALVHYPRLRYSRRYIHLSLAIAMMQWFGSDGYQKVLAFINTLRQRISRFA